MDHENLLTDLSHYGDLLKVKKGMTQKLYRIILGYIDFLAVKTNKNVYLSLEVLVKELRNIFIDPNKTYNSIHHCILKHFVYMK